MEARLVFTDTNGGSISKAKWGKDSKVVITERDGEKCFSEVDAAYVKEGDKIIPSPMCLTVHCRELQEIEIQSIAEA